MCFSIRRAKLHNYKLSAIILDFPQTNLFHILCWSNFIATALRKITSTNFSCCNSERDISTIGLQLVPNVEHSVKKKRAAFLEAEGGGTMTTGTLVSLASR